MTQSAGFSCTNQRAALRDTDTDQEMSTISSVLMVELLEYLSWMFDVWPQSVSDWSTESRSTGSQVVSAGE